jgi:hypothetical protein
MTTIQTILAGACISVAGIVVAASGQGTVGGAITLAGWLALVYGIHRFGRGATRSKHSTM